MAKDTYESHDELDGTPASKDGLGNAIVVLTGIVLLVAVILIQKAMGEKFNAGMFADKEVQIPAR